MSSPATGGKAPSSAPPRSLTAARALQNSNTRPFDATELLARLWKQNLPLMRERVAFLEAVADQALAGTLAQADRTEGSSISHKLAGSLGMFGFPQGTEIARQMEAILDTDGAPDAARLLQLSADLRQALPL